LDDFEARMLGEQQRSALLRIARQSVAGHVLPDTSGPVSTGWGIELEDPPADASGVFVTLKRRGELRGCLGTLTMAGDLAFEVARCARDSATEDPRFAPVSPDEMPELSIEISVLGPLERIDPLQPDAFVIGRHGLVVESGSLRGLLLPQVATEWGWTAEQFLRQTCRKAGLQDDAWRRARVFRFEAEVFGE
jgi:AmmeMemoRadiSam system protein A